MMIFPPVIPWIGFNLPYNTRILTIILYLLTFLYLLTSEASEYFICFGLYHVLFIVSYLYVNYILRKCVWYLLQTYFRVRWDLVTHLDACL